MYHLYIKQSGAPCPLADTDDFLSRCWVHLFFPNPLHLYAPGEERNWKAALIRLYFWLITMGRFRIFCLIHDDAVAHTAFVVPKCFKFPFLQSGDYEIGPCVTAPQFRRKGCYRYMLNHITAQDCFSGASFYMLVQESNQASIAGIEQAGFQRCGTVKKSRILKRYIKIP